MSGTRNPASRPSPEAGSSALVILSGGQDSTTCLFKAMSEHVTVYAITFDYGQRHIHEVSAAVQVMGKARLSLARHYVVRLHPSILKGTSPLVSKAHLEQYRDGNLPGGIEKTYVPHRNMLFLTIAANRAAVLNCDAMYLGVSQEDFGGYPDCRGVFVDAFKSAMHLGIEDAGKPVHIETPLLHLTKAQSVMTALDLPGCYYALAFSHTSYDGKYPPTGHDHATVLRAQGFEAADVPDPLLLRAWHEGLIDPPEGPQYQRIDFSDRNHRYSPFTTFLKHAEPRANWG